MTARRGLGAAGPLVLAAIAVLGAGAPAGAETVEVTGVVIDARGEPVPGVRVVLDGWWESFGIGRLRRSGPAERLAATDTDVRGEYRFEWRRRGGPNRFVLRAGAPVREAGGERFHALVTLDVSRRIERGGPVYATLKIENRSFLESLEAFLAALDTADERRVYEQMGRPDRVETFRQPSHREETWWYFRSGRAYRFRDGALEQVVPFEPIEPFDS